MRRILLFVVLFSTLFFELTAQESVGIGTITPSSNALLDLESTSKELLIPRLTTAQRAGIILPRSGLLAYDQTEQEFTPYFLKITFRNQIAY